MALRCRAGFAIRPLPEVRIARATDPKRTFKPEEPTSTGAKVHAIPDCSPRRGVGDDCGDQPVLLRTRDHARRAPSGLGGGDAAGYINLARGIATGDNDASQFFIVRPPAFPVLAAGVVRITSLRAPVAAMVLSTAFLLGTLYLDRLARAWRYSPVASGVAVLLVAAIPTVVFTGLFPLPESMLAFFCTWFDPPCDGVGMAATAPLIALGIVLGLACLTKPIAIPFSIAVIGWLAVRLLRSSRRRYATQAVALAGGIVLATVLMWSFANFESRVCSPSVARAIGTCTSCEVSRCYVERPAYPHTKSSVISEQDGAGSRPTVECERKPSTTSYPRPTPT